MFQQIQFSLEAPMKQAGEAGAFSLACLFVVSEYVALYVSVCVFVNALVLEPHRSGCSSSFARPNGHIHPRHGKPVSRVAKSD
jgi:hypothetical protein